MQPHFPMFSITLDRICLFYLKPLLFGLMGTRDSSTKKWLTLDMTVVKSNSLWHLPVFIPFSSTSCSQAYNMHLSVKWIAPLNILILIFFLAGSNSEKEERAKENTNQQQCHDWDHIGANRGARWAIWKLWCWKPSATAQQEGWQRGWGRGEEPEISHASAWKTKEIWRWQSLKSI